MNRRENMYRLRKIKSILDLNRSVVRHIYILFKLWTTKHWFGMSDIDSNLPKNYRSNIIFIDIFYLFAWEQFDSLLNLTCYSVNRTIQRTLNYSNVVQCLHAVRSISENYILENMFKFTVMIKDCFFSNGNFMLVL